MKIKLDNLDRDGEVLVTASWEEAKEDQSIDGSMWEHHDDLGDFAYAIIIDRPGLTKDLEDEGYDLDLDEYVEPEPEE